MWINLVVLWVFCAPRHVENYMLSSLYPNITLEEKVPISDAEAVAGYRAGIPCDVTPPSPDDSALLVIWYKNDMKKPIYSYDVRDDKPRHWSEVSVLGARAQLRLDTTPAQLKLTPVKASDAGVYRCRVDFRKSPTRNAKINFTVILPPEKITIVNDKGEPVQDRFLGPFTEGASVNVTCVSTGGRPLPRVSWWKDNELVDDSHEVLSERRVRNTLLLENLGRRSIHETYTCQASNNNQVNPLSATLGIRMTLKPLWVKILSENRPFSADQKYDVSCEAVGARPPPRVTWWKGSTQLKTARQSTTKDENVTISSLTFVPVMEDSGKFLTCRVGTTPHIVEDGLKLNIHHVPVVTLELGNNLNVSAVVEGMDVIFECNIKSNPWVYKVTWRHKGETLHNSMGSGMYLINNQSLFLQGVTRERAGIYTCVASNSEGDGESNPIRLDVKYAPLCATGRAGTHGVGRNETARVQCDVDANPADVTFSWRLNKTRGVSDLTSHVISENTRSVLTYTPRDVEDYGTLLCLASNDVGAMRTPCAFVLTPSGKPDSPHNCSITNQTFDSLQIECEPGFDGGLEQTFVIEVYSERRELVRNLTTREPWFNVGGLQEGVSFDIVVYAYNDKGRSDTVSLHAYAVKTAERHMSDTGPRAITPVLVTLTPLVGAVLGLVVTLVTVTVGVLLALRQRQRRRQQAEKQSIESSKHSDSQDSLEKNPDVIPLNSEYQVNDKSHQDKNSSLYTVPVKCPLPPSLDESEPSDGSVGHTKLMSEFTSLTDCSLMQTSLDATFRDFKSSLLPVTCPVAGGSPDPPQLVTTATRF